jgi:hypothetical protein
VRPVVYALAVLVAIGSVLAGSLPNSPASVVHDAEVGWHWASNEISHLVKHQPPPGPGS